MKHFSFLILLSLFISCGGSKDGSGIGDNGDASGGNEAQKTIKSFLAETLMSHLSKVAPSSLSSSSASSLSPMAGADVPENNWTTMTTVDGQPLKEWFYEDLKHQRVPQALGVSTGFFQTLSGELENLCMLLHTLGPDLASSSRTVRNYTIQTMNNCGLKIPSSEASNYSYQEQDSFTVEDLSTGKYAKKIILPGPTNLYAKSNNQELNYASYNLGRFVLHFDKSNDEFQIESIDIGGQLDFRAYKKGEIIYFLRKKSGSQAYFMILNLSTQKAALDFNLSSNQGSICIDLSDGSKDTQDYTNCTPEASIGLSDFSTVLNHTFSSVGVDENTSLNFTNPIDLNSMSL